MGAGDPATPEGKIFIGMQQLWDEFERDKLSPETKRGMREASEQGFRPVVGPLTATATTKPRCPKDIKATATRAA